MKKELIYFDNLYKKLKNNLLLEDSENKDDNIETQINIDATATVNDKEVPITVNVSEDTNINKIDVFLSIKNLKLKLQEQLEDVKKKVYASKLYSTNVGNNPDALHDYGYFLGQKNILMSILKELNTLCTEIENNNTIEENKHE